MAIPKVANKGSCSGASEPSAIEYEPTDFVAQLLVVKHEIPDFARKLCTLPLTFQATCFVTLTFIGRCTRGFDRVSRSTKLVGCYMCNHCRLTGGIRGKTRRPT